MRKIYVIDTNALIFYFDSLFNQENRLSRKANNIISNAFSHRENSIKLSIPAIVFVEIYRKWLDTREFAQRFYYEVFLRCQESPNIEVRPLEAEVLFQLKKIRGSLQNHEINDKLILASAMVLECPLITFDGEITTFVNETRVIPQIIN
jgi:predicted nucleic acid-binding protein